MQELEPVSDHVPALHKLQDFDPEIDHEPALHTAHVVDEDAPAMVEKVPALQLVQEKDISFDHVPPLQTRHDKNDEAAVVVDHVPAWQFKQTIELDAPTTVEYVLLPHRLQFELRLAAYRVDQVPALQATQTGKGEVTE
jgi:hypothetical protein